MSAFGTKNIGSVLPEDIEIRLSKAVETISILEGKIISTTNEVEAKKVELNVLNSKLAEANADLNNKITASDKVINDLKDREAKVSQKESALDVYANALLEKENKINKYLAIFENMKDIVIK